MSPAALASWNAWVNTMTGQWVEKNLIPALGDVLRKKSEQLVALADEVGTVTGDTARRVTALEAELADVRTALTEVKSKLADAEAKLATATAEPRTALLGLPPPGWMGHVIADQLSVNEDDVVPEASFIDDLNADSLDLVELIMSLEEEFGVKISDEDAAKIQTVQDAMDYLHEHAN